MSLKTLCHQLRCLDTRECSENVLLMSLKNHIISVCYTADTRTMLKKCSLYVAKNIISSVFATQQTQEQCSENVLFMSLKTSYHQRWLHSRHKENVEKSKRNENCYKFAGAIIPAFRVTPFVVVRNEDIFTAKRKV